ncbi:MAG TPA: ABC transporter permease subunit [Steroidobacteraceae bacterium]|nr:ABC transporter permease subunit [Steroidobacteraceae bacterium]
MRAILAVFRKEFRENLRDRRTVISALIFGPLFGPLLFAGALQLMVERGTSQDERRITLAVSHAERAPNLLDHLREHGVTIEQVAYDDAAARAAVIERRHKVVLVIPEDYGERFTAARPAPVLLYADASDAYDDRNAGRIRMLLHQYNLTIARLRLVARGVDPVSVAAVAVQDIDVSTPATRSVLALGALSYLVLLTMLMGGLYLAIDATAGERERGSLEPLLTVPVPRSHLIYGKILAACAYMLLSLVLTVTAFAILLQFVGLERFGMSANFDFRVAALVVLACAPLSLLGASIMTIVAAYTRSYREAQTWLGFVLLVPTLPLMFASVMGVRPTTALMAVPSLSQHFLITSLLRDEAIPGAYLALSIGVTLALGALLAALAGGLYRREKVLG